jgi:hypothetical protein
MGADELTSDRDAVERAATARREPTSRTAVSLLLTLGSTAIDPAMQLLR